MTDTTKLDIHIILDNLANAARGEPIDPEMCATIERIAKDHDHKDFSAEDIQALYDAGPENRTAKSWYDKYKTMKKSAETAWEMYHARREIDWATLDFQFPAGVKPDLRFTLNGDVQIVDTADEDAPLLTLSGSNGVDASKFLQAVMEAR